MRVLAILMAVTATPALAHHEVVMVTSMMPALAGLAVITTAGLAALFKGSNRK